METHSLVPLLAAIAYVPLLVVLVVNRPWGRQQRVFFWFLVPAMLWSVMDFFGRSAVIEDKVVAVRIVLSIAIWMGVQFHYFLRSF
jgi:hypothetical protein